MPTEPLKVLITGGAGFIGSHTADMLLEQGIPVTVLDDFSTGFRKNLKDHPLLDVRVGDIRDAAAVASAAAGVSHVLHLAAQVSVAESVENPRASMDRNIAGFVNVLEEARKLNIRRVVFASSAAVYGAHASEGTAREDGVPNPSSPYGLEKLTDEHYGQLYDRLYGLPTLALRYFNVYGPRQPSNSSYSGVISAFAGRLRKGEDLDIFGDGLQTRDFVFVRDVATANVRALFASATGTMNIASGTSHTLLEVVSALSEVSGTVPRYQFRDGRPGDIRHSSADISRALKLLDLPCTPLKEGLSEYWRSLL